MHAQVVLTLTGPMDHLRLVWQTGETLLASAPFDEDPEGNRYNVLLALQEMVTNVLRHAYGLDESQPIEVTFTLTEDRLRVCLRDHGPPFDPLSYDKGEVAEGTMPTACGGLGIHIARMVMDEIDYRRENGWNVLCMEKGIRVAAKA